MDGIPVDKSEDDCDFRKYRNQSSAQNEVDNANVSRSSSNSSFTSDQGELPNNKHVLTSPPLQEEIPSRNVPTINVNERIVLCIDTYEDPDHTPFKLGDGSKYSPLYMIKRVVEIFMYIKQTINKNHEFALVVLQGDQAIWKKDFTSNLRSINQELEKFIPSSQGNTFDFTSLFDVLGKHIHIPHGDISFTDPPCFVPRVILIYSRSNCVPQFNGGQDSYNDITNYPYFTLDILYIHEDPTEEDKCEDAYNRLVELDKRGFSYSFNVCRNATKLHDKMAKLLAHPLQRPHQKDTSYKIDRLTFAPAPDFLPIFE